MLQIIVDEKSISQFYYHETHVNLYIDQKIQADDHSDKQSFGSRNEMREKCAVSGQKKFP